MWGPMYSERVINTGWVLMWGHFGGQGHGFKGSGVLGGTSANKRMRAHVLVQEKQHVDPAITHYTLQSCSVICTFH